MKTAFLNTQEDLTWLKDTALKGVTLPTTFQEFACAILQGNEDCPYAVNLYASESPNFDDNYFRVKFIRDGLIYCEGLEYDGKTDKPKCDAHSSQQTYTSAMHCR